jgi:predicted GIY-YIG superfamily endonuclease
MKFQPGKIYLYALELEDDNVYVGQTENPLARLFAHCNGHGSAWTQRHEPIRLLEIREACENPSIDEDKLTKEYMSKRDINKVRGGSYVQVNLTEAQKRSLRLELNHSEGKCFKCGKDDHWSKNCPSRKTSRKTSRKEDEENKEEKKETSDICYRCGRHGHWQSKCYAKKHVNGTILEESEESEESEEEEEETSGVCYRCGRHGHWQSKCYAKKHVNGTILDRMRIALYLDI